MARLLHSRKEGDTSDSDASRTDVTTTITAPSNTPLRFPLALTEPPAVSCREPAAPMPEYQMINRVMTTFWMVRKKFSPYVEKGNLLRAA